MRMLAEIVLSNAVIATVMALIATLIGYYCRRPPVVHALWLLVLLKLVTPPLFRVPVTFLPTEATVTAMSETVSSQDAQPLMPQRVESSGSSQLGFDPSLTTSLSRRQGFEAANKHQAEIGIVTEAEPVSPLERAETSHSTERPARPTSHHPNSLATVSSGATEARSQNVDWSQLISFLWILGSVFWLSVVVLRMLRFGREVGRPWPVDDELQHRADQLAVQMGLRRAPTVKLVDAVVPPMLWAMRRAAVILLPKALVARLSPDQQTTLLAHELAHYFRRDHWVRWFEVVVLALFWWHPIAWFARRELQRAEEQCCDAWVLWALPDQKYEYARAILATIDFLAADRRLAPMLATGLGTFLQLERRFEMILHKCPMRCLPASTQLALIFLGLLILPLSAKAQVAGGPARPPELRVEAQLAKPPELSVEAQPAVAPSVAVEAVKSAIRAAPSIETPPPLVEASASTDTERRLQRLEKMMESILAEMTNRRIENTPKQSSDATLPANGLPSYPRPRTVGAVLSLATSAPTLSDLKKQRIDIEEQLENLQDRLNKIDDQITKLQSDRPAKPRDSLRR